jgi:hypothetical protein
MATANDAFERARVELNDVGAELYTNAILMPFLQIANDELSNKMLVHGLPVQKQIAAYMTVAIGIAKFTTLPTDFINPVKLWQRPSGQTVGFEEMRRESWEPASVRVSQTLGNWDYRDNEVIWQAATAAVQVRMDYNRMLTEIDDAGDPLEVFGSLAFYGPRIAQLAAKHIGQNPVKALELKDEADDALDDLIIIGVRNQQHIATRRKPFRRNRRRRIY